MILILIIFETRKKLFFFFPSSFWTLIENLDEEFLYSIPNIIMFDNQDKKVLLSTYKLHSKQTEIGRRIGIKTTSVKVPQTKDI